MDFKKWAGGLASPYWGSKYPSQYLTTHPETGAVCGIGLWWENTTVSDKALWNIIYCTHPELDKPKHTYYDALRIFNRLPQIKAISQIVCRNIPGSAKLETFSLADLSNLMPMSAFCPILLGAKKTNAIQPWVRQGLLQRRAEEKT